MTVSSRFFDTGRDRKPNPSDEPDELGESRDLPFPGYLDAWKMCRLMQVFDSMDASTVRVTSVEDGCDAAKYIDVHQSTSAAMNLSCAMCGSDTVDVFKVQFEYDGVEDGVVSRRMMTIPMLTTSSNRCTSVWIRMMASDANWELQEHGDVLPKLPPIELVDNLPPGECPPFPSQSRLLMARWLQSSIRILCSRVSTRYMGLNLACSNALDLMHASAIHISSPRS